MASPPPAPPRSPGIENPESQDERKALLAAGSTSGGSNGNGNGNGNDNDNDNDNANANANGNKVKLMAVRFWRSLRRMFVKSTRMLKLNDELYASCISNTSNVMVMGILTLNIYSASYFLAWRKEGSVCHIFPETASAPASAKSPDLAVSNKTTTTFIQLVVVSLPFTCLPLTIGIGCLAKMSKDAVQFLGCAAGLVTVEIMYIIALGGVMTECMSHVSGPSVAFVTSALLTLLLLMWGYCCYYPKCLRSGVFCKCCCSDVDAVDLEDIV